MTGLEKAKSAGVSVLGYFVWWSIRGVKVSRDAFRAALKAAEIDFKVKAVCLRTAFCTAKRDVKASAQKGRVLVRNLRKGDEHVVGLIDEDFDKATAKLGYSHSATMRFNTNNGELSCDNPHRAFEMIQEKYEENQEFMNSYDVRQIVMQLMAPLHSFAVRERGGLYFIPVSCEAELLKIEKLFELLPGDCYMALAPQIDVDKSRRSIYKSFIENLKRQMKSFREDLEGDKYTTKRGWEAQLDRFKELKQEIEFYSDALQFSAESLQEDLENLTNWVRDKLVGD